MTALRPKELLELRNRYRISRARMARFFQMDARTLYRWEKGQDHAPLYATILYYDYLNRFGYLEEDTTEGRRQDVETAH